jgi:hypothetical protein
MELPPSKRPATEERPIEAPAMLPPHIIETRTTLLDSRSFARFTAPAVPQPIRDGTNLPVSSSESPQKPLFFAAPALLPMSPLLLPIAPGGALLSAATQQMLSQPAPQLQLVEPTNLTNRFEDVAEAPPAYEQGPATMEPNLSFFFCDEELEPFGDVLAHHPNITLAHDHSFG